MTRTSVPRPERASLTAALRAAVGLSAARRPALWPRLGSVLAALVLAGLLAGAPGRATPAIGAAYDRFYANFSGEELMRAINADRAALGIPALGTDATLEGIARDRPATCPSDATLTIRGRARDMADRGYFSHTIPGCTVAGHAFSAFDLLTAEGYTFGAVGETISQNDYPSSATSYATGCALDGSQCHGSTSLPWTVAVAERGFMASQAHRDSLLSTTYRRFGCGAWRSGGGTNVYSCYFASSGNGILDGVGPVVGSITGAGAVFAPGSSPTFTAVASDGASVLADGWAAIDGVHVSNWAWDHAGGRASLTATARAVASGTHTFTWWVRDASTRFRAASFQFTVSGATPAPTAARSPSPTRSPTTTAPPGPTARATGLAVTARPSPPLTSATVGASAETTMAASAAPAPKLVGSTPFDARTPEPAFTPAPAAGIIGSDAGSSTLGAVVALGFATAAGTLLVGPARLRPLRGSSLRRAFRRWFRRTTGSP